MDSERKRRRREVVSYLFFGAATTAVNIVSFALLRRLSVHYLAANGAAWLLSVSFAYVTNRRYVFRSRTEKVASEMARFFGMRVFSGLVDMAAIALLIGVLGAPEGLSKVGTNVLVVVLNYVMSKKIVFSKE